MAARDSTGPEEPGRPGDPTDTGHLSHIGDIRHLFTVPGRRVCTSCVTKGSPVPTDIFEEPPVYLGVSGTQTLEYMRALPVMASTWRTYKLQPSGPGRRLGQR